MVRLYPVDYRYMASSQQYKKYQWIEVDLTRTGMRNDKRKESRRPDLETLKVIDEPLGTENGWYKRRCIVDNMPHRTIKELKDLYDKDRTSLGIVRPARILDFKINKDSSEWKPAWKKHISQLKLFQDAPKPLRKIPYKFQFVFECEDDHKPHQLMIEDWEVGALFLSEVKRGKSDEQASQSVRDKFLNDISSDKKDTRFFVGTRFPYNTWLIIGVFWPPKSFQPELF